MSWMSEMPLGERLVEIFKFLKSDQVEEYVTIIMQDTDRGCMLSVVEFLNFLLEQNIRHKLTSLSGASKNDLDFLLSNQPLPPIGSFGVRIVLAQSLGLITSETRNALKKLQRLRNKQAHSLKGVSISIEEVEKIVNCFEDNKADELIDQANKLWDGYNDSKTSEADRNKYFRLQEPPRRLLISVFINLVITLIIAPNPKKS